MAKARREKIPIREAVHFRPGEKLGQVLSYLAEQLGVSRGECAKRMVSLAIHGFDLDFYPIVDALTSCPLAHSNFDECCHRLLVYICKQTEESCKLSQQEKLALTQTYMTQLQRVCQHLADIKSLSLKLSLQLV